MEENSKPEVIRQQRRQPFIGGALLNPEPLVTKAGEAKSPKRSRYQDELRAWAAKNPQSGGLFLAPPPPSRLSHAAKARSQKDRCET